MIELLHTDCMEYMATLPDKAFDLAIVDPPYGILQLGMTFTRPDRKAGHGDVYVSKHDLKEWDNEKQEYTGRQMARGISYILNGGQFGVENGFVVMALA